MTVLVAELIAKHLPNVLDRSRSQPFVQVFEACQGRAMSIEGDEVQQQFKYSHCVLETVDGKSIFDAVKDFKLEKIFESSNPFNAFAAEAEFQKQLIQHGSVYPTERMFKFAGTGGFNPNHHFAGKMYGVHLLSHNDGIPRSWKLKDKFLNQEVLSGQKRPRQEEEEQEIVG